jgi:hypothetical protein
MSQDGAWRRAAASLAAFHELPGFFKSWLASKGERPEEASRELVGLSNTYDDRARPKMDRIAQALRLPPIGI